MKGKKERGGKAGRLKEVWAAGVLGGCGGAGMIHFISPTNSRVATEPSSVRSPAAGGLDRQARLHTVIAGGTSCP